MFENEGFTSPTMERHCVNSVSVKYVEGPPETLLEEAKVSNGEGAGGSFNRLLFPLVMLGLAYALVRGDGEDHGFLHEQTDVGLTPLVS